MKIETDYITRELHYFTINDDWLRTLPKDKWCLILISNLENERIIDEIISKSLTNNVAYICGIGSNHDYIHNQADSDFVQRNIGESKLSKPKYHVMTVGIEYLDEGIWFGLNLTNIDNIEIDKIQIIDTDCRWKEEILLLISKYKNGFLPVEK